MRFSKDNVQLDQLEPAIATMTGNEVHLERVLCNEINTLVTLFESPSVYKAAHLSSPPCARVLKKLLFEKLQCVIWKIFHGSKLARKQIGYIGWINYAGPPFLVALPIKQDFNLSIFHEGFELVIKAHFTYTPGNEIWYYIDQPVAYEIHTMLTEGGFDLWQEVSGVNPEQEASYVMERATFNAYYL